jgi:glyoxylase-like metal-dependent hydrolase (beta-lactamase superfamily II)
MPTIDLILPGFPGRSNRGYLGWCSIVLIKGDKKILFDTGSYGVRGLLLERLGQVECAPEDVDMVIVSHCHWDHMVNMSLFPRAEYVISKKEWDYIFSHQSRGDIHVAREVTEGLSRSGRLNLIEKEDEIEEGIKVLHAPGHTPGLVAILLNTPDGKFLLASDAIKNRAEYFSGEFEITMDRKVSEETLSRLGGLSDFIIPGHETPFTPDGTLIKPYADLMVEIYARFSKDPSEVITFCLKRTLA